MKLNAENLKNLLWETLQDVRSGDMEPGRADAVAAQAREILRTGRLQLAVCSQSRSDVPEELVGFATGKANG